MKRDIVWKEETCKTCFFRIEEKCYKLPPINIRGNDLSSYPRVSFNHEKCYRCPGPKGIQYQKACSKYTRKLC